LWIATLFHLTEDLSCSFKRWRLWKEPVVDCRRWLWKEPVVLCGNWNVRQAMSQQVFKVITFCANTCFESFSTLICRIVHHTVLKFSECCNKLLPQASTCPYQYMRFSCSLPQTSASDDCFGHWLDLSEKWLVNCRHMCFYPRDAMVAKVRASLWPCVCPSVCVCYTSVFDRKEWTSWSGFRHAGFFVQSHTVL